MTTTVNSTDSTNVYSPIKDSNLNLFSMSVDPTSLYNGNHWRHHYSQGYFYDPTHFVNYGSLNNPSYSSQMDLTGRRKNATRETTATLKAWLYEHRKNPYPTKSEKVYLAIITKMTLTQVSTWFANARRRLKKENKMTWSPRNRTTEDDDDDQDDDDDRDDRDDQDEETSIDLHCPTSIDDQRISPDKSHQQLFYQQFKSSSHLPSIHENRCDVELTIKQKEKSSKRKSGAIWSLADMAEKNDRNHSFTDEQIHLNDSKEKKSFQNENFEN